MTQQEIDMCKWNGKSSHCKYHIRYHIIFVTKYRRKCLDEIKQDVFDAFRYVEDKSHIKIYNMNLDANHIHLLLSFPPDYSLSQTVNRLKQMTTNYLYRNERTKNLLKQFYWEKKTFIIFWQFFLIKTDFGVIIIYNKQ